MSFSGWAAALALVSTATLAQEKSRPDQTQRGSAPTPADRGTAESSQRGSMGASAGDGERTATPGAGIESGQANGLAGGRTDEGPRGGTGIREERRGLHDRARDQENDQARGPNRKGSLLRPADSPAQMNRERKAHRTQPRRRASKARK